MPGIIIIGVGPGIGISVARRFAHEGFAVGVIARSQGTMDAALATLTDWTTTTHGVTADAGDEVDVAVGARRTRRTAWCPGCRRVQRGDQSNSMALASSPLRSTSRRGR